MSLAEVWEGKQKKFEKIGYVVLVVFEVQACMPFWCKNKGIIAGQLCSSFGVLWPVQQDCTWQNLGLWPTSIFGYFNLSF